MSYLHRQLAAQISIATGGTENADIEKGVDTEHVQDVADVHQIPQDDKETAALEDDSTTDPNNASAAISAKGKSEKSTGGNSPAGGSDGLSAADRAELEAFRARKKAADAQAAADKAKQDAQDRKARWLSDPLAINRQVLTTSLVDSGLSDDQIADVLKRQPRPAAAPVTRQDNADKAPPDAQAPADNGGAA